MQTILIVEDKASMARMLEESLRAEGFRATVARDGEEGIKKVASESPDVVLTDLKLPGKDGMAVLRASREHNPLRPVIVMTAYGSVETAVAAMKDGAFDFITKPFDVDHLIVLLRRAIQNQRLVTENILLKEEFSSSVGMPTIIGKSPAILGVAQKLQKAAPVRTTVLLLGESGTGKELFARAAHQLSDRKDAPFVPINCSAIPRELMESELFGHEKGAFTGAHTHRMGKFGLADKGTVFLDEIGDLDMALQAKLLRVLQEGEMERVGGSAPVKVDLRIIAASNRDLQAAVSLGEFREDLYYRINVFPITIPPLRERREDIPLLVEYFVEKYSLQMNAPGKSVSPEALKILTEHGWKGNVRELQNTIERAIILCDEDEIKAGHITVISPEGGTSLGDVPMDGTLKQTAQEALRVAESERIRRALVQSSGNKMSASKALGVSYKTLLTKIKDYGLA